MTKNSNLLDRIDQILSRHRICNSCLGRLFGQLSHGLTNEERGKSLRISSAIIRDNPPEESESCEICQGLTAELDGWVEKAIERVKRIEFETFLFGTRLKENLLDNQKVLEKEFELNNSEDFSHAINRKLGKKFRDKLYEKSRKVEADFESPDLTVLIDFSSVEVELDIRPVCFYGRYRKLARGIPQTVWHCNYCRGVGCERCSYTGREYDDSVEERVSEPLKKAVNGESTVFHGAGREDVDVLTLGRGRPFVVEVKEPKIRKLNYGSVVEEINDRSSGVVEIRELRKVTKDAIKTVKQSGLDKIYRIKLELGDPVKEDRFKEALSQMEGRIFQRTPERVSHRRAAKVRVRKLKDTTVARLSECQYQVDLLAERGLYIKELFSAHRTVPSLIKLLGTSVDVEQLDVLDIPGTLEEKNQKDLNKKEYTYNKTIDDNTLTRVG
ncbi:tRNA pseudouridine(54/55) synthase Pus10 [Candidatus Bipolaricaulota bacterium]|nr:tRNA pseudouridine(54/55) synthase Pus10 [Candidatus Bipolaricaulota bacterium]